MEQHQYMLEMIDIDKSFPGVHALDQAQFKLRPGTIHSLMGENGAGKSTLMKCLFGIYKKDSGTIRIEGKEVDFANPKHALDNGVAMVHQELNQVLHRNVMENVWLGRLPLKKYGLVDSKLMFAETMETFRDLEINISPTAIIGTLSVSQRQMVEIAKAVSYHAKILVLDEPTSSLTEKEVDHLFRIIRKLTSQGVGIIYISHRMDEILRISDDITVMRDGQWIATRPADELDTNELIRLMVNRDLTHRFPGKTNKPDGTMMSVSHLSGKYEPTFHDVSFTLRKGEILGVAGLMGSRRTELLNTIFGVFTKESGEIAVDGKVIDITSPEVAKRNGFALITEERRATGLFPLMNIYFNTIIANIGKYGKVILSQRKIASDTQSSIQSLKVKTASAKTAIRSLSGGNQQKVIIGRWLLTKPEILLLDEPTRGIDVGAKFEIYQLIINLANEGKGIVMVSSEMPELLGICDRILVMSNGRLAGIVERGKDFGGVAGEQEHILKLAGTYI
jgi:methyl-galactoside transport system ATP-binding protein